MNQFLVTILLVFTFTSCRYVSNSPSENFYAEKPERTLSLETSPAKMPQWIKDLHPDSVVVEGITWKLRITHYAEIDANNATSVCELSDDLCTINYGVFYTKKKVSSINKIGTSCDADQSFPDHQWSEFIVNDSGIITIYDMTQTAPDSVLDERGFIKPKYETIDFKRTIDTVIKELDPRTTTPNEGVFLN